MKIMIDIPEELYKRVKTKYIPLPHDFSDVMDKAINNGIAPTIDTQTELTIARSQGYECGFAEGYEEGFAKGKERPTGEWIEGYCNKCGGSSLCDGWGRDVESKFCPNCGAKMTKEANNE